ncbi:putative reverse transcriptase domain-containing protein [Tanacetum coccineum]
MPVELGSFDVIIGMDWLANHHAVIVCDEKIVRIPYGDEVLILQGDRSGKGKKSKLSTISCTKTQKYIKKGKRIGMQLPDGHEPTIEDKLQDLHLNLLRGGSTNRPTLGKSESIQTTPSSDIEKAVIIPYYTRKDFLDCHFPGEWEIARDAEINPFKDVLVFRRMVEFLEAIPINLKSNMWNRGLN